MAQEDGKKETGQDEGEGMSLADALKAVNELLPTLQKLAGNAPAAPAGDEEALPGGESVEDDDDTPPAEDEDEGEDEEEAADEEEKSEAMDAAIKALVKASKTAPKTMRASMDSAIAGLRKAQVKPKKPAKTVATVDAAEFKRVVNELEQLKRGSTTKNLMSEIGKRDALAGRLSAHIGTFDHADKTLTEVATYGVEKLGIKCSKGQEVAALDGYLHGREAPKPGSGMDSKHAPSNDLEKYLQGA
ncbi:hypothetical protein LMG10661_03462 [Ralstonia syzygii subsp. syzygii]|nr:hypothetical protein LMG10661_03462 [Ralstonia syzygii subsp. syzygii]